MRALLTFRIAWRALAKNKMRAGLTVLGVVIGIAAVTTMVSLGQGASDMVLGEFNSFGNNMILVFPGSGRGPRRGAGTAATLTPSDCDAIIAECPSIQAATPIVGTAGQVVYGDENWSPDQILGVGPGYAMVRNWEISRGAYFTESDVTSAAQVCVIGHKVARQLFQTANPIGSTVRIANIPFRIIGLLKEKGANIAGESQDDIVLLPYTTVRQRIFTTPQNNVGAVLASAKSPELMRRAEREIELLLLQRHRIAPGNPPDFTVQNTKEFAAVIEKVIGVLTMLISSIAAISLLVGGVGIMNMMLVSVTERTREIGIRMAVGASSWNILWQFIVESIVLSVFGGVIGFLLGVAASAGVAKIINQFTATEWPTTISLSAGILAVVFSAAVGVFFGFYPALRASRLDPIDALRYE